MRPSARRAARLGLKGNCQLTIYATPSRPTIVGWKDKRCINCGDGAGLSEDCQLTILIRTEPGMRR